MPSSLSSPSPLSLSSSLSSYHRLPPSSASHDHLIVVFFFFFVVRLFRPAVHLLLHGVIPDLARVSKVGQEARHAPIHGGGELGGGVKAPPPSSLLCRHLMHCLHPSPWISLTGRRRHCRHRWQWRRNPPLPFCGPLLLLFG